MRSISSATWLSLAIGWLTAAAAVAVVAVVPDDVPGTVLEAKPPQARVVLEQETGEVQAGLLGPHGALVTVPRESIR